MKKIGWKIVLTGDWTWRKAVLFLVNWGNILVGLTIVSFPVRPLPMKYADHGTSKVCCWPLCFRQRHCAQHYRKQAILLCGQLGSEILRFRDATGINAESS
jgi:hypothetical protein